VGWFQETLPKARNLIGEISLLRLDGDLYESTLVCLRNLYPSVVRGGFVIIDDYGLKGCRMACEFYFEEIGINPYLHHIDAVGRYFVKD
jgi:O-methyltransferase